MEVEDAQREVRFVFMDGFPGQIVSDGEDLLTPTRLLKRAFEDRGRTLTGVQVLFHI
jgi:hypothetical protein